MDLLIKEPEKCTPKEIQSFLDLISEGGEVMSTGLERRVKNAKRLVFLQIDSKLAGISALKIPNKDYHERVFRKSKANKNKDDYPFEIGWIFIPKEFRGKKLSRPLIKEAIKSIKQNIFATARTDNIAIYKTLKRFGFKKTGKSYKSERGDYKIALFLKEGALTRHINGTGLALGLLSLPLQFQLRVLNYSYASGPLYGRKNHDGFN